MANTQTLKFFDKNLPIKITCDASKLGLEAMLEQLHGTVWHPTAFASRSLTAAEQNYSQIEKETLSIVFSCGKFHEYVYGLRFVVENDHKPLISIFQRVLSKSPLRITNVSCYDYNATTLNHGSPCFNSTMPLEINYSLRICSADYRCPTAHPRSKATWWIILSIL